MGKKAIRTLIGFEISETGKVARSQYPDRLNLASGYVLDGSTKAGDNMRLETEAHNAAKTCHRRGNSLDSAQVNGPVQHRGFLQQMQWNA
jgi:hypothetical protein